MRVSLVVLPFLLGVSTLAGADEPRPAGSTAAAEKEKKDKPGRPVKVYTDEDLKKAGKDGKGGAVTFLAEPEPAPASADTPATTTPSQPASGGAAAELGVSTESGDAPAQGGSGVSEDGSAVGQQGWRDRAREHRETIATAEANLARLQARLDALTNPQQQPQPIEALQPDPQRRLTKDEDRIQLEKDLETARTALDEARRARDDFLEEARRKGVPPGWVEER